jgi:hypothetical protein
MLRSTLFRHSAEWEPAVVDRYTKAVLTLIASCLLVLTLKAVGIERRADAAEKEKVVACKIVATEGAVPVLLNFQSDFAGGQAVVSYSSPLPVSERHK